MLVQVLNAAREKETLRRYRSFNQERLLPRTCTCRSLPSHRRVVILNDLYGHLMFISGRATGTVIAPLAVPTAAPEVPWDTAALQKWPTTGLYGRTGIARRILDDPSRLGEGVGVDIRRPVHVDLRQHDRAPYVEYVSTGEGEHGPGPSPSVPKASAHAGLP